VTTLGRGQRWGALALFRLASAVLRGATALHQRRMMTGAGLRAALSMARCVQRAGARVVLGRASRPAFIKTREEDNGVD